MKNYAAPWSKSLNVISSLVTAICIGVATSLVWTGRPWAALLPVVIICSGILFTIRGYTVTPDAILVHRLLWTTRLPLFPEKILNFFRHFAAPFLEKRWMGKDTSDRCRQIERTYEKARPLSNLCRSRPVSSNLFRLRTLVTFTGPYDYL